MGKFKYGRASSERLNTCHPDLERVARRALVISPIDITIVCGLRSKEDQERAFANGFSKKRWPNSKHNGEPPEYEESMALDFAPFIKGTIPWNDEGAFYQLVGIFKAAALLEEVTIRCGADWDRDGLTEDQTFMDLGHIELVRGS